MTQGYFRLELSNDEEWYLLFADVPHIHNGAPRAKFAAEMGKDAALTASHALAAIFNYPLHDKTDV